jgi:hypothetical protein
MLAAETGQTNGGRPMTAVEHDQAQFGAYVLGALEAELDGRKLVSAPL